MKKSAISAKENAIINIVFWGILPKNEKNESIFSKMKLIMQNLNIFKFIKCVKMFFEHGFGKSFSFHGVL